MRSLRFGLLGTSISTDLLEICLVTLPEYKVGLTPSANNPNLPNDELEFVIEPNPPFSQSTPYSQQIVNNETNCSAEKRNR